MSIAEARVSILAMHRCLAALLALLLMVGSLVEPAVGVLRDGTVHHETTASAATHADGARGDHGHEDGLPSGHQHGGKHQHGTGADHCTHQHGLVFLAADLPGLVAASLAQRDAVAEYVTPATLHPLDLFHPPRV